MSNNIENSLQDYCRSINPRKDQQHILIYGRQYHLWRDGNYLGVATWTEDKFIGDSFQVVTTHPDGSEKADVYIADRWDLIINIG